MNLLEQDGLRKRWTRAEYHQMADCGVLTGKYELIEGEIRGKMPQNPPHVLTLKRLAKRLIALFGYDFVRMQAPVRIETNALIESEPEPDLAVTRAEDSHYEGGQSQRGGFASGSGDFGCDPAI